MTDIGRLRPNNEDNVFGSQNAEGDVLLLLFDGMGGHRKGDVAARLAAEFMEKEFQKKTKFTNRFSMYYWFHRTIKRANQYINRIATKRPDAHGMGTTMVGFLKSKELVLMVNIGDSRGYLLSEGKLVQITEDETYVNFLYRSGKITKEECANHPKRHMLMNALGVYPSTTITLKYIKQPFDALLLCSDGLYMMVEDEEIQMILNQKDQSLQQRCQKLVDKANEQGGKDNIAVAIYEVEK